MKTASSGRKYYINHNSGTTQWNHPVSTQKRTAKSVKPSVSKTQPCANVESETPLAASCHSIYRHQRIPSGTSHSVLGYNRQPTHLGPTSTESQQAAPYRGGRLDEWQSGWQSGQQSGWQSGWEIPKDFRYFNQPRPKTSRGDNTSQSQDTTITNVANTLTHPLSCNQDAVIERDVRDTSRRVGMTVVDDESAVASHSLPDAHPNAPPNTRSNTPPQNVTNEFEFSYDNLI